MTKVLIVDKDNVYHGFYSYEAALTFGTNTYLSDEGEEVVITSIYKNKDDCDERWWDLKYVGRVVKHVTSNKYDKARFLPPDLDDQSKEVLAKATEQWLEKYSILATGMKLTVESMYWEVRLGFLPRRPEYQNGFGLTEAAEIVSRVAFAHQMGCSFPSVVDELNGEKVDKTSLEYMEQLVTGMF